MKILILIAAVLMAPAFALAEGQRQSTCPVMEGSPVNPALHVDAEGYRIYVCCRGCLDAVRADPAKYIAKLQAEGVELERAP